MAYKVQKGIYAISCLSGGKARVYIGSSVDIKQRFNAHLSALKANRHRCKHLQNYFNLYGDSQMRFEVLSEYPEFSTKELRAIESQYLEAYLKGTKREELLNSTLNTTCPLDDPTVKEKQRLAAATYWKDNPEFRKAATERGRERFKIYSNTEEHKQIARERFKNFLLDEEITKRRIDNLLAATARKVRCLDNGMEFVSAGEAARWLQTIGYPKAAQSAIGLCCRGGLKTAYKHKWEFVS